MKANFDPLLKQAVAVYRAGYLAQAEIICREALAHQPDHPVALYVLGDLAQQLGLRNHAIDYLSRAVTAAPQLKAAARGLAKLKAYRRKHRRASAGSESGFLLIKAWGYGFFADINHVLGALLLAELTNRTPVIHWGRNSRFSDGTDVDAFTHFFDPVSDKTIGDLQGYIDASYFPPKWTTQNLRCEDVNKWSGDHSRMAGLYFFNRPQKIAVCDFHVSIVELVPWIDRLHPLYGMSIQELYRYLVEKYLVLKREIADEIDAFYEEFLSDGPFVSVHMRGSDKAGEWGNLREFNQQYFSRIDGLLETGIGKIFLLTDSAPLLTAMTERYGDRVVYADCRRTENEQGLHYQQPLKNRIAIGVEVLKDVYLAAKADVFIGNGASNPSCMTEHLKDWQPGTFILLHPNTHYVRNTFIHTNDLDLSRLTPYIPKPW